MTNRVLAFAACLSVGAPTFAAPKRIQPPSATPEPPLAELLADLESEDPELRDAAACRLAERKPKPSRAVPVLVRAFSRQVRTSFEGLSGWAYCPDPHAHRWSWAYDPRDCVRMRSGQPAQRPLCRALNRLGGSELAARAVLDMLRSEPSLRFGHNEAVELLGCLGPEAVPTLRRGARDPNALIAYLDVRALGRVDPPSRKLLGFLEKLVEEQSGAIQQEAVRSAERVKSRLAEHDSAVRSCKEQASRLRVPAPARRAPVPPD
jgi:HEAT repeat protein